jgi:hypothetical protein
MHNVSMWIENELATAGDGGDDGERVCGGNCRGFFLRKIAHIVVVEVEIYKRAQVTLAGKQVLAQVWVRIGQLLQSTGHRCGGNFHCILTCCKGPQGAGDVNGHSSFSSLLRFQLAAREVMPPFISYSRTSIGSGSNRLFSSVSPASKNEFVTVALPCATAVMTYEHPSQCAS